MTILPRTQFGNPILRQVAAPVNKEVIHLLPIQKLIVDMRDTLLKKNLGIGLAAPQVGECVAVAVVVVRPSKTRPQAKPFDLVLINPVVTKTNGKRIQLWEGCISAGSGGKADLFAKVPRYSEITVQFYDEKGVFRTETHTGLEAHVIQHEIDHLNGVLFVDRVKDTKTFMTYKEYLKMMQTGRG